MRQFGGQPDLYPVQPDTVGTVVISSALAVAAQDWPTDAHLVRFASTAPFWLNMSSTGVSIPTTAETGSTAASDRNELINDSIIRQITSTGYSITRATSGVISASFWQR